MLVAIDDAARRYQMPMDEFGQLIDGCEMDVTGRTYATSTTSSATAAASPVRSAGCRSGCSTPPPRVGRSGRLANALGVALQLTNILRDIREDLASGSGLLPKRTWTCSAASSRLLDGTLDPQDGRWPR